MTQTAPHAVSTPSTIFCAALELSASKWKIAFGDGDRHRIATIDAGDWKSFDREVEKARQRFEVAEEQKLSTCYEAGRDGFWIHRALEQKGITNVIIDPSSIEVSRRARRAKTDSLDAVGLMLRLVKHLRKEKGVWSVVRVPSPQEEDARRLHRERERLTKERTGHITRVKSLLALCGVALKNVRLVESVKERIPGMLCEEITREVARLKLVDEHMDALTKTRAAAVENHTLPNAKKIASLERLKAIGPTSASVLVTELFGWRKFKNGKQVGSCAGLTPTPFASGSVDREQGISKAGNKRVRTLCVEIAWGWLRYQPDSDLAKWFTERFEKGSGRSRRLGIVALARKLLVALWNYVERGVVPEGAVLKA